MALRYSLLNKASEIKSSVKINRYLFSFFLVVLAFFTLLLLNLILGNILLLIFIIPILLSAWYGGFGAGILSTSLSLLFLFFSFLNQSHRITGHNIAYLAVLLMEGILISLLSGERTNSEKEREKVLFSEKLARRHAEQQTRIREHFISVAAHELKSPVTSLKAYGQLLKKSLDGKNYHESKLYIHKIELQTDKLINFINDLLDISKMTSRNLQYNFSYFNLKDCVNEAIESIRNLLVTHTVELRGIIKQQVYADKERCSQVITNLLSNAIKYSPDAKKIVVTLSENPRFVQVSIKDFGIGISQEHQEKIFNRFFRVGGSDESKFKGLGLGLYLSSEIIKKHKGKIWVESKVGKGSTFNFTIPYRKNQAHMTKRS